MPLRQTIMDNIKNNFLSTHLHIIGSGVYLPKRVVTDLEIDARINKPAGWTRKHAGVIERRFVGDETAAFMGAEALRHALRGELPDLLISASATPQQLIPCTAALVAAKMGWNGIPCFDVNATCMGFLVALDIAASFFASRRYKRIAIVCSEIASKGLNWDEPEAASILGDGAAAFFVECGTDEVFKSHFETWPEGVGLTCIKGGGSAMPSCLYSKETADDFLFHMDGPGIFRLATKKMEGVVARLIGSDKRRWEQVDAIVPHQASPLALRHMASRLHIPAHKLTVTAQNCGNIIAASIPAALHQAIETKAVVAGSRILLLGTSAGFSAGGVLLTI